MNKNMPILAKKTPLRVIIKQALIEYTAWKKEQYQRNSYK